MIKSIQKNKNDSTQDSKTILYELNNECGHVGHAMHTRMCVTLSGKLHECVQH